MKDGIWCLSVDNLRVNPNIVGKVLTKPTAAKSGVAASGGVSGRQERIQAGRLAKTRAQEWIQTLPTVKQPNGTYSHQIIVGNITVSGTAFINETYAKNLRNKQLPEIMDCATHAIEWLPNATFIRDEEGKHHNYKFNVYHVRYNGHNIEFKTKKIPGEPIYTMRFI